MSSANRRGSGITPSFVATCEKHKGRRAYASRKEAKAAIRGLRGADRAGMREWKCEVTQGYHISHLPESVRIGRKTLSEVRKPA